MRILVTPVFERAVKKLHRQQKSDLDTAIHAIAGETEIGEAKVGDLAGIRVYKFRMLNQLCLLSYRVIDENSLKLLTATKGSDPEVSPRI
ncbi:MAG: type II toxin-antitoxin system RelE/ParE family toxin [Patescibacteria group bacterium]